MSTANRLLNVLSLFTMDRPQWTVEEAAAELGMTLSTAYRYFRSLVEAGLVAADTPSRYTLGPAIIQYDRQLRLLDPLIVAATPEMRRLAMEIGADVAVMLCRLYRTEVICVHQESVDQPDFTGSLTRLPVSYGRGQPMPLHRGAPSKAILANMNFRQVRPIYQQNPQAMAEVGLGENWNEVKRSLRALRGKGAIVTKGELQGGRQGMALPIFANDAVVGSLSLVMFEDRDALPQKPLGEALARAVTQIQTNMAQAER